MSVALVLTLALPEVRPTFFNRPVRSRHQALCELVTRFWYDLLPDRYGFSRHGVSDITVQKIRLFTICTSQLYHILCALFYNDSFVTWRS